MGWYEVEQALPDAHSIAWDGCHKIYVLLDAAQTKLMRTYGYEHLMLVAPRDNALAVLREWFENSCGLRFISSVASPGENEDFTRLIAQWEDP